MRVKTPFGSLLLLLLVGITTSTAAQDSWSADGVLTATDAINDAHFGRSVCADGEVLLVGAPWDELIGAVYVYRQIPGSGWIEEQKLSGSDSTLR